MNRKTDVGAAQAKPSLTEQYAPWPRSGPDFNSWCCDVGSFAGIIQEAGDESWWGSDWQLKYLEIRIDTRDGHFVLFDRDKNRIDPERVLAAIDEHRAWLGGTVKLGRSRSLPSEARPSGPSTPPLTTGGE